MMKKDYTGNLYKKYNMGQVFYKGKPIKSPQKITSIHKENGFVSCNFEGFGAGSYPMCRMRKNELIIENGYMCDKIKIWLE